jgi:hypothetical protein
MNESQIITKYPLVFLFCNISPFTLGVVAVYTSYAYTIPFIFVAPLGLIAAIAAIVTAWRKGHNLSLKLISSTLNGLAICSFGFQTFQLLFWLLIGFPGQT